MLKMRDDLEGILPVQGTIEAIYLEEVITQHMHLEVKERYGCQEC